MSVTRTTSPKVRAVRVMLLGVIAPVMGSFYTETMGIVVAKVAAVIVIMAILYASWTLWAISPELGCVLVGTGIGIPLIIALIFKHDRESQNAFWITFASGLAVFYFFFLEQLFLIDFL